MGGLSAVNSNILKTSAAEYYIQAASSNSYVRFEARQKFIEFLLTDALTLPDSQLKRYYEKGLLFAKQNSEEAPDNVMFNLLLLGLFNRGERFDKDWPREVLNIAPRALELSPTRPQIYQEIGFANLILGNKNEALSAMRKALELNFKPFESHWDLVVTYASLNMVEEVSAEIQEIIERGYSSQLSAARYDVLGRIYTNIGNHARAEQYFKKASELDGENYVFAINYALSLYYQNRRDEAMNIFESIKTSFPEVSADIDNIISSISK